jgi:hypothetical protein
LAVKRTKEHRKNFIYNEENRNEKWPPTVSGSGEIGGVFLEFCAEMSYQGEKIARWSKAEKDTPECVVIHDAGFCEACCLCSMRGQKNFSFFVKKYLQSGGV